MNPYLEAILATILWASGGVFIKYLQLPPSTLTFFRLAIPMLLLLLFFWIKDIKIFHGNIRLLLLASALNGLRFFLFAVAYTYASIGNAVIMLFTWPIFLALFSILFLKEKVEQRTIFSLGVAFLGMILIYLHKEISFSNHDVLGMTAMVASAAIYALTIIIYKKESEKYSPYEMIFYQNVVGAVFFLPFLFINQPLPTLPQVGIVAIYSILIGLVGFALFFSALRKANASTISILSYVEIVSAIAFGIIFFQERLTWNMVAGAVLILFSVTMIRTKKAV